MAAAAAAATDQKVPVFTWDDSGDDSRCIFGQYRGFIDGGFQPDEAWVWKVDVRVDSKGDEMDWKELIHHSTAAHAPNSMPACKLALEWFLIRLNESVDVKALIKTFRDEALSVIERLDRSDPEPEPQASVKRKGSTGAAAGTEASKRKKKEQTTDEIISELKAHLIRTQARLKEEKRLREITLAIIDTLRTACRDRHFGTDEQRSRLSGCGYCIECCEFIEKCGCDRCAKCADIVDEGGYGSDGKPIPEDDDRLAYCYRCALKVCTTAAAK